MVLCDVDGMLQGADWFESALVDYDVCSNWGNWVSAAGLTGVCMSWITHLVPLTLLLLRATSSPLELQGMPESLISFGGAHMAQAGGSITSTSQSRAKCAV